MDLALRLEQVPSQNAGARQSQKEKDEGDADRSGHGSSW
jgi:hypothetical protein